jgi:hypothetical protein
MRTLHFEMLSGLLEFEDEVEDFVKFTELSNTKAKPK